MSPILYKIVNLNQYLFLKNFVKYAFYSRLLLPLFINFYKSYYLSIFIGISGAKGLTGKLLIKLSDQIDY